MTASPDAMKRRMAFTSAADSDTEQGKTSTR